MKVTNKLIIIWYKAEELFLHSLRRILSTHCVYLDIYISRKIRLCVVGLESQYRSNLLTFWKNSDLLFYFFSVFCRICQIPCFLQTVAAIPKSWCNRIAIWHNYSTQIFQPFWNSINSAFYHWIWQLLQKKENESDISEFSDKKSINLTCRVVWNWPSKSTTHSLIFCEM